MDKRKAEELFKQIEGEKIEEIVIEDLINNGKSAAVFLGKKDDKLFAIKIFDNDVVRKDESKIQEKRIDLELSLKEHKIPNLVKIIGGGETTIKNNDYYYLIMEFVKGMNLHDYIKTKNYELSFIIKVITILIDVTERLFLEKEPIVHRDIKPENIMVSENGEIILMDMGVIKIVGNPSFTDEIKNEFLGTLRYSSPEYLFREELDDTNGWRATNIYQIGTVLYELIMKKPIFDGVEPYSNLVRAIEGKNPIITSTDLHPDLIQMARNMIQKDWRKRLEKASISGIKETLRHCELPVDEPGDIYNNIRIKAQSLQVQIDEIENLKRTNEEKKKIIHETNNNIWKSIDGCILGLTKNEIISSVEKTEVFSLKLAASENMKTNYKIYRVNGHFKYGFAHPILMMFDIANDENNYCIMNVVGIIPDDLYKQDLKNWTLPQEVHTVKRLFLNDIH